jgi:hypothetical protein
LRWSAIQAHQIDGRSHRTRPQPDDQYSQGRKLSVTTAFVDENRIADVAFGY